MQNQPVPQPYFHRPLSALLTAAFQCGFVMDAIEERAFRTAQNGAGTTPLSWSRFSEIPPALVVRLRSTTPKIAKTKSIWTQGWGHRSDISIENRKHLKRQKGLKHSIKNPPGRCAKSNPNLCVASESDPYPARSAPIGTHSECKPLG